MQLSTPYEFHTWSTALNGMGGISAIRPESPSRIRTGTDWGNMTQSSGPTAWPKENFHLDYLSQESHLERVPFQFILKAPTLHVNSWLGVATIQLPYRARCSWTFD